MTYKTKTLHHGRITNASLLFGYPAANLDSTLTDGCNVEMIGKGFGHRRTVFVWVIRTNVPRTSRYQRGLFIGHSLCVCGYAGSRLTLTVEFMHGHRIRSRGVVSQLNRLFDDTAVQSLMIETRNSWPAD